MIALPEIPGLVLEQWPEATDARRRLTLAARELGQLLPLATWARAQATAPGAEGPTIATWSAVLGVGTDTLGRWRRADPKGLGALSLAPRGGLRPGAGRPAGTQKNAKAPRIRAA